MTDAEADRGDTDQKDAIKLERVLEYLRSQLKARIELSDADVESLAATMALLRVMAAQAEAILILARTSFAEAGGANLRTLFEAWCDLRIILADGDRNENGRRFRIFALLELEDFMRDTASAGDDNAREIETVRRELAHYEANNGDLVAAVKAERRKKSKLWSGKSRTAMLRLLNTSSTRRAALPNAEERPVLVDLFKFLSWDSHNIITGILDVTIDLDDQGETRINFGHRQTQAESGGFNCGLAVLMLMDGWSHFANAFNLPTPKVKTKT